MTTHTNRFIAARLSPQVEELVVALGERRGLPRADLLRVLICEEAQRQGLRDSQEPIPVHRRGVSRRKAA